VSNPRRTALEASIGSLFKAYRASLERFVARRARPQDASDLAQEVYLRLLRFPPERIIEKPHAYLYRIASNVVHDFNSQRHDEAVTFDSQIAEELAESAVELWSGGLAESLIAQEELQRILLRLPRAQLAALLLHKRDGMTVPEIARHLNVPVDTVKSRIAFALAACRASRKDREA
jgi:RNA polymerase sigma-19 factor, ECF subfamily